MDAIKALLKQIVNFWNGKEKNFKRNVIIIAGAVLVAIIVLSIILNQVPYATLYSGLDDESSKAVLDELAAEKIDSRVQGNSILVPAKDADRLRLSLSPKVKGGNGLDILALGQGLAVSESDKKEYRTAQIAENIRRSINTLNGVVDCRVMPTIPDDSALLITTNKQEATAGVILTLKDGFEISAADVQTIKLFVEKAVPGLKKENISIMDTSMRNLDTLEADATAPAEMTVENQKAMEEDTKKKLRQQVMNLLTPVFGYGRVTAEVSVELNFDSKTVDSEEFKPVVGDSGIARTIDKLKEKITNGKIPTATDSGQPGTTTNTGTGDNAGTPSYPVVSAENGTYDKVTETIQNEITKINTHLVEAKGSVKNLTVAVVVDNTGLKQDLTDEVKELVAKTVGVDAGCVAVSFMPMAGAPNVKDTGDDKTDTPEDAAKKSQAMMPFIIAGAVLLVAVLGMLILTMRRKPKAAAAMPVAGDEHMMMQDEAEGFDEEELDMEGMTAEERLAAIELVKDSSAKEQIGRLIEKNPELVANLLRTWLSEED